MKKLVVVMLVLFVLFGQVGSAFAAQEEVTFCHKKGTAAEKTMTLPKQAFENGHKTHGDSEGACESGGGGGTDDGGNGGGGTGGGGTGGGGTDGGGTTTVVVTTDNGKKVTITRGTLPVCFPKNSAIGTMDDGSLLVVTPEGKTYPLSIEGARIEYASFAVDGCKVYTSTRVIGEAYEDLYSIQLFDNGGTYVVQITETPDYSEKNVEVVDESHLVTTLYAGSIRRTYFSLVVKFALEDKSFTFLGLGDYGTVGFGNTAIQKNGFVQINNEAVMVGEDPEIASNGDVFVTSDNVVKNATGATIEGENVEFGTNGSEIAIQDNGVLTFAEIDDMSATTFDFTVLSEIEIPDGFNLLDFWNR